MDRRARDHAAVAVGEPKRNLQGAGRRIPGAPNLLDWEHACGHVARRPCREGRRSRCSGPRSASSRGAPPPRCGARAERYVLFDRPQSNNCARAAVDLPARARGALRRARDLARRPGARRVPRAQPRGEDPAARHPRRRRGRRARGDAETTAARGGAALSEAAVILEYLEERHASPWRRALVPADALARARMRLVVRVHDIYLASPNAHAARPAGLNVHTMGALFIDPPDPRRARTRGAPPPPAERSLSLTARAFHRPARPEPAGRARARPPDARGQARRGVAAARRARGEGERSLPSAERVPSLTAGSRRAEGYCGAPYSSATS